MSGTATGSELNIHYTHFKLNQIKNEKKLLEQIKEVYNSFDEYRECFPVDLKFNDDKGSEISCKNSSTAKSLLIPDKSNICIGHYFVYSDANYTFSYKKNLKSLSANISNFDGYKVFEEIKNNKDDINLESQDTGSSNEEKSFFIWLDKKAKECFLFFDITGVAGSALDSQKEKEINSFIKEVYSNLKKGK